MKHLLIILLSFTSIVLIGQSRGQKLRGYVLDKVTQTPISFADVVVENIDHTITDDNGYFEIDSLKPGRYNITISYFGYQQVFLPNVVVNTGKETVLNINMEEKVMQVAEVVVSGEKLRNRSLNEMSLISTRVFSVEETQKYAFGVNDPARTVTSFAGVVQADDGNNHIVIRGNSPNWSFVEDGRSRHSQPQSLFFCRHFRWRCKYP